jgi:pimeloyl-ACP methyl ester carboxylesterase
VVSFPLRTSSEGITAGRRELLAARGGGAATLTDFRQRGHFTEDVMDRRSFLAATALSAAGTAVPKIGRAAASKTYLLVHGAWHGGWCWSKVALILRGRGHTVLTPTQTGLGERSHLLSKSIDLDVFVTDIANVVRYENLNDVVLVGHSFGGNSISGVADIMRDRLRQLIYLDAVILENGQSVFSQLPKDVVEARTKAAQETSGGLSIPAPPPAAFGITDAAQTQFVQSRFTPHPFNTFVSPLKLANKVGNDLPTTYIICADPIYKPLEASRNWVKAAGWKTIEIQCGHDAMVIAPDRLADLLDADSA